MSPKRLHAVLCLSMLAVVCAWAGHSSRPAPAQPLAATGPTTCPTEPATRAVEPATAASEPQAQAISYWLVTRQAPRPLRIHHLRIDLRAPGIELATALADDPDGSGPATAALEPPMSIATRAGATAMVNANPWQGVPDASGHRTTNWRQDLPVEILGLTTADGRQRTADNPEHCAFWLDATGGAHIGSPPPGATAREGVAGFAQLVRDGKIVVPSGPPIHPRTALGLDATSRWLYLVVVDGRQTGYSEGMSNDELAAYMRDLGCRDAMNLDGGGSSIMILSRPPDGLRVMNDPSTKRDGVSMPRPIPSALVVRQRRWTAASQVLGK